MLSQKMQMSLTIQEDWNRTDKVTKKKESSSKLKQDSLSYLTMLTF